MTRSLEPSCKVCSRKQQLQLCPGCKVTHYCSEEHQTQDWLDHEKACSNIKTKRWLLDLNEGYLREQMPDVFTEHVGYFWGIWETRSYMESRYDWVQALLGIGSPSPDTTAAISLALDESLDMLRLHTGDYLAVNEIVPALFLRLDREQDCYNFVKRWEMIRNNNRDEVLTDQNIFESVDYISPHYVSISRLASLTLLKFRLLRALQGVAEVELNLPQELVDQICSEALGGTILRWNDSIPDVAELERQIDQLYAIIDQNNRHFWPEMLNPESIFEGDPRLATAGTLEQAQVARRYVYPAWFETPGAVDFIRQKTQS